MKETTKRSVTHATFSIERTYDAAPARVFAAFAKKESKAKWFKGPPEWTLARWDMDFRVGGREIESGGPKNGPAHTFEATYLDIVEDARIIYAYDMYLGDTKLSVSLTTIQLEPAGKGTRLLFTEHGAFLDGHEDPALREEGTRGLLEALGQSL
jgi:uncharacterized protein YndB with AHSA1/START domain